MGTTKAKVHVADELSGQLAWLTLDDPPGNVLDIAMIDALRAVVADLGAADGVKAVVFEGAGEHFSYGASVPEHQPGPVRELVPRFHALFRDLLDLAVPTCAVVRGRCLGGGLELASFCTRVFASPDAQLGLPEITLGVFAPLGSLLLPERVGRSCAEDLCLSGRVVDAKEARSMGLVDVVGEAPGVLARSWIENTLLAKSAVALRYATRAVRQSMRTWFLPALAELERLYLDELMAHEDPREGVAAFMEKRPPVWKNR